MIFFFISVWKGRRMIMGDGERVMKREIEGEEVENGEGEGLELTKMSR